MKDENKKDEQLNALFREYVEEEKSPPESVTLKAKQLMGKETERVEEVVPALAAEAEGGTVGGKRRLINTKALYFAIAAAALLIGILLIWRFTAKPQEFPLRLSPVSLSALTEKESAYEEKEFLPFIEKDSVTIYKEYALKENAENYRAGDVVAYYLEYTFQNGIRGKLYVEAENVYLDNLASYKLFESEQKTERNTYYIDDTDVNKKVSYFYFSYGSYGYNLEVSTVEESEIKTILQNIDNSF